MRGITVTMRVTIKDADTGSRIEMDVEYDTTVEETIESAASYWEKEAGAYVLRCGKRVLRGQVTLAESGIRDGDVLELIPDPEGG